jgi:hypothetical protein
MIKWLLRLWFAEEKKEKVVEDPCPACGISLNEPGLVKALPNGRVEYCTTHTLIRVQRKNPEFWNMTLEEINKK